MQVEFSSHFSGIEAHLMGQEIQYLFIYLCLLR
jgi:hypothetical protein